MVHTEKKKEERETFLFLLLKLGSISLIRGIASDPMVEASWSDATPLHSSLGR